MMLGETLDRFELLVELASGGMATVHLARLGGAGGFQRLYAIKRLYAHLAKNSEFVEMFFDEARLAARIHHPNVVPILEIGGVDPFYYLVMEYIEGDTIGHLLHCAGQDDKRVPPRVAVRIALDVLAGLHAAHELKDDEGAPLEIVHRDVSPHNIMVGVDGVARITDFGVARAAARLATTRSGQLKGKIAYMAPEQARSERLDRRADVFALGVCLWEMLAMQRLFRAEDEGETLNRLLYEPIPTLGSAAPAVAAELDAVCMKALARDPDARFRSAAEFSDALEAAAGPLDLVGGKRDVAAFVADVLGGDIAERRATVRAALAEGERRRSMRPPPVAALAPNAEMVPAAASSTSAVSPSVADSGPVDSVAPRSRTRRLLVVGGAALVAAGIALAAGTSLTRRSAAPPPASGSATAPPEPPQPPLPSAEATESPPPSPTPSLQPAAPTAPSARPARPPRSERPRTLPSAPPPAVSVPPDMLVNPYR